MTLELLWASLLQGCLLAYLAYALMIPFRLLDLPDLSAEGAYPLGGALYACGLLLRLPPLAALLLAISGAALLGLATALLHLRLRLNTLLAGILLSTMIYSVNLRLMGQPNIALFAQSSLLTATTAYQILQLLLIVFTGLLPFYLFLQTEWGLRFRAVGLSRAFAERQGLRIDRYTLFGFGLATAFSGLAGALMVDLQRYMDIGMGSGIVIHALAALMLGEAIVGQQTLRRQCFAPLVGSLLYQQIQGMALSIGLPPSDLKLFTGSMVLFILVCRRTP